MGAKLHCSRNIFTNLMKNNHDVLTIALNSQDTCINLNSRLLKVDILTGFNRIQGSMDKSLERSNRDFVRNTMLKHEEAFKEQVHELHRLYRVQKKLMAELRSREPNLHSLATANTPRAVTDTRNRFWGSTSTSETSHSSHISNRKHSTAQLNFEYSSLHPYNTASEDPLRSKGFDLEQPAEEETTVSREHQRELWPDGESDIELTLSIGFDSGKKKSKHWPHPEPTSSGTRQLLLSTTPVGPERGEEYSDRDSLQRPPWLFQTLSLNRT